MKKGPNPLIFLIMSLVTFVVGGGMVFVQYSAIGEQTARVDALRNETKDEKTVQADLEKSQANLDACVKKLSHLEQGVTESAYIPTMLKELERVGKEHGIEVVGVRPFAAPPKPEKDRERKQKDPYHELLIEVKGRGQYGDVMRFMEVLQSFPKIVAVRTVSLMPRHDAVGSSLDRKLDITVELTAYAFPPSEERRKAAERMKLTVPDPGAAIPVPSSVSEGDAGIQIKQARAVQPGKTGGRKPRKHHRKWKRVKRYAG